MADKTALETIKGIIEDNGGTSDAETIVPALKDLGEVIGSGGGGSIADGSVTTAKLADGAVSTAKLKTSAVTNDKLAAESVKGRNIHPDSVTTTHIADGAITLDKLSDNAITAIRSVVLVAADSQTDQALTAFGFSHDKYTPAEMGVNNRNANGAYRLCWISGTTLEVAPIASFANLQTQTITLYAKGLHSTASGTLGVDTSWTITANE